MREGREQVTNGWEVDRKELFQKQVKLEESDGYKHSRSEEGIK